MNLSLKDITNYLESVAPLRFQENYDNAGLILGHPEQEITGAIMSLDCTEEVVKEAIEAGYNLVIAHHPIVFRGIRKFDLSNYVERTLVRAIKHDVAIYAVHTNLDNVLHHGVNEKIAMKLDLCEISSLKAHDLDKLETQYTVGSGLKGKLSKPLTEQDFLDLLKEKMNLPILRHTQLLDKKVEDIALCGGAGSFLTNNAIAAGADVFISSDFKYHDFFDANGKIVLVDMGHYESEYFTIELLFELVTKKFPNFAARCTKVTTNPVRYY